jgi:Protein of unknown function (DUF3570)
MYNRGNAVIWPKNTWHWSHIRDKLCIVNITTAVAKVPPVVVRRKGAVVAVTKFSAKTKTDVKGIKALTAAAITLPGLLHNPALAYEEEANFSYGHYQEGKRELFGAQSAFSPIEVESIQGSGKWKLTDRLKFAFNYSQDTWGGATPITTAPLVAAGNGNYDGKNPSLVTGATPRITRELLLDKNFNFYRTNLDSLGNLVLDANGNPLYEQDNRYVHTLSLASPEVRKQGDFKLSYDWDNAGLDIGGGISLENDYESRFGSINTRWEFNQKQTTLNVGLSYTNSDTHAILDHDANGYFTDKLRHQPYSATFDDKGVSAGEFINGTRQDWSANIGLTQILTKSALVEANLGFTRSTGYMANPYKGVSLAFIDPEAQLVCPGATQGLQCASIRTLFEQRPEVRNQWNGSLRYVQHIELFDAALHAGYRVFSDDWGITSHTFDADWVQPLGQGWSITPRVRYYSQDAADFYTPMLSINQGLTSNVVDPVKGQVYADLENPSEDFFDDLTGNFIPDGNAIGMNPNTGNALLDKNGRPVPQSVIDQINVAPKTTPFERSKIPQNFSSDHRLSGYGALSGGVTVTKQFAKGVALDLGFEYYTHQGSLKIGSGGENNFADFDYWTANAALRVNLEAMTMAMAVSNQNDHTNHHIHHHSAHAPAGVMFDHMLPKAGEWMAGYRYMYSSQSGAMLNGTSPMGDLAIVNNGCPDPANGFDCFVTPNNMSMHMQMLDLMYAPTDWLTLMLMPQFMDMTMGMRKLDGVSQSSKDALSGNIANGVLDQHITHHVQNSHETGGIGDLGMYALFKLFDDGVHHLHVTGGFSAPTGDVDIQLRRNHQIDSGYIHYGMQLGSGTWDFKPSVTYTGQVDDFSWGAQANGTVRMESKNESGYRLGDMFQTTAWGSYNLMPWLTASVRGVYTLQGAVKGQFPGAESGQFGEISSVDGSFKQSSILKFGPMDYPQSYGGKFWDVGFGLSAMVPSGALAGNRISVEYLHPVEDDVNGYQLERDGSVSATWSLMF